LVRQSFQPPDIVQADRHMAAVANIIGNWSINAAREVAWGTAVALWQVRDDPTATRLLTGGLARTVAMASRGLLAPSDTGLPDNAGPQPGTCPGRVGNDVDPAQIVSGVPDPRACARCRRSSCWCC